MIWAILLSLPFVIFAQTGAVVCSARTPTINLEETGALAGVPQDHQDGIGTCYANVARNILLGLSGGSDSASYLDLALAYKREQNELGRDGLDAGNICPTLAAAQVRGFCPQTLAPLETGARTEITRLLGLDEEDPFRAQAIVNESLRNYFARSSSKETTFSSAIPIPRVLDTIRRLRENPRITLPFPGTEVSFINPGAFKSAQGKNPEGIYNEAFNGFRPELMRAIVDGRTPAEIFDLFSTRLRPTLQELGLAEELTAAREDYLREMGLVTSAPEFRDRVNATVEFFRASAGRSEEARENFLGYCFGEFAPNVELLNNLGPLLRAFASLGIEGESLVDPDGNLLPMNDVFQLAVAPACLQAENRRPLSQRFSCDDNFFQSIKRGPGRTAAKMAQVRTRVIGSLQQGIPVGRSFPMPGGGGHVNTIVGFRYSARDRGCEYLIRDSATGRSDWASESQIFEESDQMSLVQRQP